MLGRLSLLIAAAGCVAALWPSAAGAGGPTWATVNVCSPTAVGVRAAAPGRPSGSRPVQFTLQWLSPDDGWVRVEGQATSPWLPAGNGGAGQAGWTFNLFPPPPGVHFTYRGVATVGGKGTFVTSGGLAGVDVGTSLASCRV